MSNAQLVDGNNRRIPQDHIPLKLDELFCKIYLNDFKDREGIGSELNNWQFVSHSVKELMFYAYQKGMTAGFKDALKLGMVQDDKPLIDLKRLKVSKV